jgi:OOP family OmpA-OmpF porin
MPVLHEVVAWLRARPTGRVVVTGHTAQYGTEAYRDALSKRRAQAVVDALVALQVDPSRLTPRGVGSRQPERQELVNGRHDAVAARANRRVTIELLPS